MEYYNNILAVESAWLIDNNIITGGSYRRLTYERKIHVLRRGCNATQALVEYESLPERFKVKVREIVGDPYKVVKVNRIAELIDDNLEASQFFDEFITYEGKYLPPEKRREYYANTLVLDAVRAFENQHKSQRAKIGGRKARVIDFAIESIATLDRSRYPFNLPDNARAFERKYRDYCKNGYESLIHNAYKNGAKNAAIVTEEGKQVLTALFAHHNNLNNAQVAMLYNNLADQYEWKQISEATVSVWRDKLELITFAGRRGSNAYKNQKAMQIKRSLPSAPLYFWSVDGWDVELMFQHTVNGKTTYTNRVTMIVVVDAYFMYPIGYAIGKPGESENSKLIIRAVQNALRHTEELFGQMYKVQQIQSDNYAKKANTPYYNVAGEKFTPAAVGNAKSKPVEKYFKYLNQKYCQLCNNWSGFGVTSRKELQPNGEALNRIKHSFPTYEEVVKQIEGIMERERQEKRMLFTEGFYNAKDMLPLSKQEYLMQFGETNGYRSLMRGEGLIVSIEGVKRTYDCFDINFRQYASTKWEVRYDSNDLHYAVATNEDETLQFMLEEKYVQPMALVERTEQDSIELKKIREFNKQQDDFVTNAVCAAQEKTQQLVEGKKQLEILQKFMITDGGQHKNKRNALKRSQEGETIAETLNNNDSIYDNY